MENQCHGKISKQKMNFEYFLNHQVVCLQDKSVPNDLMKVNATVVTNMACNDFLLGETICTDYPRSNLEIE